MLSCLYSSNRTPFNIPDGYSFCIYYVVFCAVDCVDCPFGKLPHHLVDVKEFQCYPVKPNFVQLKLF